MFLDDTKGQNLSLRDKFMVNEYFDSLEKEIKKYIKLPKQQDQKDLILVQRLKFH